MRTPCAHLLVSMTTTLTRTLTHSHAHTRRFLPVASIPRDAIRGLRSRVVATRSTLDDFLYHLAFSAADAPAPVAARLVQDVALWKETNQELTVLLGLEYVVTSMCARGMGAGATAFVASFVEKSVSALCVRPVWCCVVLFRSHTHMCARRTGVLSTALSLPKMSLPLCCLHPRMSCHCCR